MAVFDIELFSLPDDKIDQLERADWLTRPFAGIPTLFLGGACPYIPGRADEQCVPSSKADNCCY